MSNIEKPRKVFGLLCGTLTGWFGVLLVDIITSYMSMNMRGGMGATEFAFGLLVPAYIILGLPVALLSCFILGAIIWDIAERNNKTNLSHAVLAGGVLGAILGGIAAYIMIGQDNFLLGLIDLVTTVSVGMIAGFVAHRAAYGKGTTS